MVKEYECFAGPARTRGGNGTGGTGGKQSRQWGGGEGRAIMSPGANGAATWPERAGHGGAVGPAARGCAGLAPVGPPKTVTLTRRADFRTSWLKAEHDPRFFSRSSKEL